MPESVPTMYAKDKRYRVTVRLTEDLFQYVTESAEALGVSPSEFIRMGLNLSMTAVKKATANLPENLGNKS